MSSETDENGVDASSGLRAFREREYKASRLKGDSRREAFKELRRFARRGARSYTESAVLQAIGQGPDRHESLVWFWFNHFNVFSKKGLVEVALPGYVDDVLRPHASGRFKDLLLAVTTHPAMLVYLDNARNVAGRINENHARELLELHTLGVEGGYTQQDVAEVARVLTGVGLRPVGSTKMAAEHRVRMRQQGEFMFDPRKHDFGSKRLLGFELEGAGFSELEKLVDFLATRPATAQHVSRKLCQFLLGDDPSAEQVQSAATIFLRSGGDIAETVASVVKAAQGPALKNTLSFKDPHRYVVSAVRLLSGGEVLREAKPVVRWLASLGQPMFGCRTPDGYSLQGNDWLSAGQLIQRFDLAKEIVSTVPRMLAKPVSAETLWAKPEVQARLAALAEPSRKVLGSAQRADERLSLLLSSPEFMYRSVQEHFI